MGYEYLSFRHERPTFNFSEEIASKFNKYDQLIGHMFQSLFASSK